MRMKLKQILALSAFTLFVLTIFSGCDKTTSQSSINKIRARLNGSWYCHNIDATDLPDGTYFILDFDLDDTYSLYHHTDYETITVDTGVWEWSPKDDEIIMNGVLYDEVFQVSVLSDVELWYDSSDDHYYKYERSWAY